MGPKEQRWVLYYWPGEDKLGHGEHGINAIDNLSEQTGRQLREDLNVALNLVTADSRPQADGHFKIRTDNPVSDGTLAAAAKKAFEKWAKENGDDEADIDLTGP